MKPQMSIPSGAVCPCVHDKHVWHRYSKKSEKIQEREEENANDIIRMCYYVD